VVVGLVMNQRTITIVVTQLANHGYKLEMADSGVTVQEPPHEHAEPSDALLKAARLLTTKANDLKGLRL
jgi:hypothetical protein